MSKKESAQFNLTGFIEITPGVYQKAKTVLQPREREALLNSTKQAGIINSVKTKKEIGKNSSIGLESIHTKTLTTGIQTKAFDEDGNWFYVSPVNEITFEWKDEHISLNEWYSSKHWTHRNKAKQYWHNFFKEKLPTSAVFFEKYEASLFYNSNLDPSNSITMIKLCEDMLQKERVITNDNRKFCKGIHLIPVDYMDKFSYRIIIKRIL